MGMLARRVRPVVRPAADGEPAGRVPRVHRQVPRRADPRARGAPTVTAPGGHPRNGCRPSPAVCKAQLKSRNPYPHWQRGPILGLNEELTWGPTVDELA